MSSTPRKEIEDALSREHPTLAEVHRGLGKGIKPKALAVQLGLERPGYVTNYRMLIAAMLDGDVPSSWDLRIEAARTIEDFLRRRRSSFSEAAQRRLEMNLARVAATPPPDKARTDAPVPAAPARVKTSLAGASGRQSLEPDSSRSSGLQFGTPAGVGPGQRFKDRRELTAAYVHRPPQNGISGNGRDGANSIVVSGGYIDDEDHGDFLLYTGMGGNDRKTKRQVADQDPTVSGNAGLILSHRRGFPVRVVRGPHKGSPYAPSLGYVYSGLYEVSDTWVERGQDGFKVIRFRLDGLRGHYVLSPEATESTPQTNSSELDRLYAFISDKAADLDRDLRFSMHGVTADAQTTYLALSLLSRIRVDRRGDKPERQRFLAARSALDELAWDHDALADGERSSGVRPNAENRARELAVQAGVSTTELSQSPVKSTPIESAQQIPPRPAELVIEAAELTAILDSETYGRQRQRAGRAALSPETTKRMLALLIGGDYRTTRGQLAHALALSIGAVDGPIAALKRLMNVEGYDVVEIVDGGQTIRLNRPLLIEQFGLS